MMSSGLAERRSDTNQGQLYAFRARSSWEAGSCFTSESQAAATPPPNAVFGENKLACRCASDRLRMLGGRMAMGSAGSSTKNGALSPAGKDDVLGVNQNINT